MTQGSVLIIDDDELYRLELEMQLREYQYEIWLSTGSSREVLQQLEERNSRPDVLLIDVRLKEPQTGIDLAEKLREEHLPVIFLTAFPQEEQFVQALRVTPAAYLIKPARALELHRAIQLAVKAFPARDQDNTDTKTLTLRDQQNFIHEIPVSVIYAVESYGNLLIFHTTAERYFLRQTMKKMSELLRDVGFIRIHKSYLIAIRSWKKKVPLGKTIIVADREFPVGRAYRHQLLALLNN